MQQPYFHLCIWKSKCVFHAKGIVVLDGKVAALV